MALLRHSGESRNPGKSNGIERDWLAVSSGFRPRIKYGVTFFRRNDGNLKGPVTNSITHLPAVVRLYWQRKLETAGGIAMTSNKTPLNDTLDAFCTDTGAYLEGVAGGPLSGLTFAAKDIFDVAGHVTGGGNPDWKATHPPAERTAWIIQTLVDAGATMAGKTHTCLLYTSPSPRDGLLSRMPSSA